jgi:hypothetical protein
MEKYKCPGCGMKMTLEPAEPAHADVSPEELKKMHSSEMRKHLPVKEE